MCVHVVQKAGGCTQCPPFCFHCGCTQCPPFCFFTAAVPMLDWDDAVPSLPWTPAKKTEATTLKTPPPAFRKMQSRSSIKCENVGPWEHHEQSHHDPTCDKCVYARKRRFWMKLTPLDDASGCNTTWMCAKPLGTPDSEWGLGCKACAWSVKQSNRNLRHTCVLCCVRYEVLHRLDYHGVGQLAVLQCARVKERNNHNIRHVSCVSPCQTLALRNWISSVAGVRPQPFVGGAATMVNGLYTGTLFAPERRCSLVKGAQEETSR